MSRFTRILVLAVLALAATASSGTAASPARAPLLGVVPHTGAPRGLHPLATAIPNDVFLQESPCSLTSLPQPCWTMRTNTAYAIYWVPSGFAVGTNYESLINRYLADVAASSGSLTNVYSVATQYFDSAAAIHYQSSFGGAFVDTDPFPARGCTATAVCLTDDQLQQEIQKMITANGWQAGPDTMFFMLTPEGVSSCVDGTGNECSTNEYCAYHSDFIAPNGEPVLYANEPYDAGIPGCSSGSSPNADDADDTINTVSHEQIETITDPWGDAWLDSGGNEIADKCAWMFGTPLGGTGSTQYNEVINGDHYWLQMEYSNDGSTCMQQYAPTAAPSTVAPPVLSGTAALGQVLSSTEGSWAHAPSSYAYQWQRCAADGTSCANIAGATTATYQLTAADVQQVVRSQVSAGNVVGTSAIAASAASAVVVGPPAETGAPVISGPAGVGKNLSTTPGTWSSQANFAYQWLRCSANGTGCTAISGAGASTHVAAAADAGHTLEVQVVATNGAGAGQALSNRTGVVVALPRARKAPHISGKARVGRRLSAVRGTWSGPPKSYRFQWLRCNARGGSCARIHRATRSTYRLTRTDASHRLRVRVTAVNAAGSKPATSRSTARVPATR
jgi:hypothetical protein